jgi:hypothetical protein
MKKIISNGLTIEMDDNLEASAVDGSTIKITATGPTIADDLKAMQFRRAVLFGDNQTVVVRIGGNN